MGEMIADLWGIGFNRIESCSPEWKTILLEQELWGYTIISNTEVLPPIEVIISLLYYNIVRVLLLTIKKK